MPQASQESKPHKARNFVFGLGIFVVYLFVLAAGFRAFYPGPDYNDFCKAEFTKPFPITGNCTISPEVNTKEQECYTSEGMPKYEYDANGCYASVSCDYCNKDFQKAQSDYANVVFIVSLALGVLTILIGILILSIEPVGSALIAAGIGAVIYGTIINWQNFTAVWRFILLLLVLVGLVYFALHLNKKNL